ncbi:MULTISPECIES: Crp/Fnr family transcriptional regulator [Spirosoma]|uniref:Crp/Fnr family transcriptional regulator n=1 Tax=Spirosoma liriopis TaxID=2937440 RepID=A0ABT0HSS6_9BACT|nr:MULTISPECIES: Crp/Fnr family transcriptional regulator [Spirosoma]MCK8494693.1 Crp/Fnr family transcriptional regulator [Spirosoma liriopis]UHG93853.1 Crp/Fnr family transcriptional regulator [Spirosoma oryzicola]
MVSAQHPILHDKLQQFALLSEEDIRLGSEFWSLRTIAKHEFFNFRNSVCRYVGFIVKGLFRVYYMDPKTEQEHNLFFISENMFLTALKSLLTQTACPYNIEALEDAELLVIQHDHLLRLYPQSHGWERFGRVLAEQYLMLTQGRSESLLTQSAEERYIDLITNYPDLVNRVSLGHISSYLGIKGPSLSRIRAQMAHKL